LLHFVDEQLLFRDAPLDLLVVPVKDFYSVVFVFELSVEGALPDLEVMPEDVKVLYVRILVAQCFVDGELNPIKVADIYLFMSKISLSPDS
jgi:hypothetical protein